MSDRGDTPQTVTVPIRPPADPLGSPEVAEVPIANAGHWDIRRWSDRPPL